MAKREQIGWDVFPEEDMDELMKKHLYFVPGVIVSNIKKQSLIFSKLAMNLIY